MIFGYLKGITIMCVLTQVHIGFHHKFVGANPIIPKKKKRIVFRYNTESESQINIRNLEITSF